MAEYVKRGSIIENILSLTVYDSVESVENSVRANFTKKTNEWIGGIYDALVAVREVAVHDVVPVVRCKDCKHYWKNTRESDEVVVCLASAKDDGYCSEGERREDG